VYGKLLEGVRTYIITAEQMNYAVVSSAYMMCCEVTEVIPSTVSQYTGLTDKNGVKIFEGDEVEWHDIDRPDRFTLLDRKIVELVEFMGGSFYPVCTMPGDEFEVIRPIHDTEEQAKEE